MGGSETLAHGSEMTGFVGALGEAEVGQLGDAGPRDEDVVGLDVAVDDVARVGVLQRAGHVKGDVDGVADRQPAESFQQVEGVGAVHVFKDEVMFAGFLVLAVAEGAHDIGVIEEFTALGFAIKAVDIVLTTGQLVVEDFNRDLRVVALFPAEVNRPHAAFTEEPQQTVSAESAQISRRIGRTRRRLGGVEMRVFHDVSRQAVPLHTGPTPGGMWG